jgi:hypothetical protein
MTQLAHKKIQAAVLQSKDLDWIGVRFLDPIGKVFRRGEYYYRAIYPEKVAHVKQLLASEAVRRLEREGLMLAQIESEVAVEGFAFCVRTEAASWNIPPQNWVLHTLTSAALNWIQINEILLDEGYQLIDAHYANYVLDGNCRPVWVDLGSIQPLSGHCLLGFEEFCRKQLYPLIALGLRPKLSRILRSSLFDHGLSLIELLTLLPLSIRARFAGLVSSINNFNPRRGISMKHRLVLKLARGLVSNLPQACQTTYWASYHEQPGVPQLGDISSINPREETVKVLVDQLNPASILDIGANSGRLLSLLAAPARKLLAIDPDEYAVQKFVLWSNSNSDNDRVSSAACIGNFHDVEQCAELVLGMALTHHLALTEHFKFDYISKRFAELSSKSLITEFMPNGLCGVRRPEQLPSWYTLENFVSELGNFWQDVTVIEYNLPQEWSPRTLILCDRKKL